MIKNAKKEEAMKKFETRLAEIEQLWKEKADAYGDVGSCVLGAGFSFKDPAKKKRFISPRTRMQGSISWEHCRGEIRQHLENAGATDIVYHWGNMD